MITDHATIECGAIAICGSFGSTMAGDNQRSGGLPTGLDGLSDAFARHRVGGRRRIADEEHSPDGQR